MLCKADPHIIIHSPVPDQQTNMLLAYSLHKDNWNHSNSPYHSKAWLEQFALTQSPCEGVGGMA